MNYCVEPMVFDHLGREVSREVLIFTSDAIAQLAVAAMGELSLNAAKLLLPKTEDEESERLRNYWTVSDPFAEHLRAQGLKNASEFGGLDVWRATFTTTWASDGVGLWEPTDNVGRPRWR